MRDRLSVPGDGLLSPLPLLALAVLLVNDHILKEAFPGLLTGKLSDFAGLVFFPLLLQAALELAQVRVGVPWTPSRRLLVGCVLVTGGAFALVQVWAPMGDLYEIGLATLQWPFRAAGGLATGSVPSVGRAHLTADPTDLIALPMLLVPLRLGWVRAARFEAALEPLPG